MRLLRVFMLFELSHAFPAPVDTVMVQVQKWEVVGTHRVVDQVLLNGFSLPDTSPEVDVILRIISADAHLPNLTGLNQALTLANHTVLRSRECILEGTQVHWSDRVFCDGEVYLTLDHTDHWTPHVPQAVDLGDLLGREEQRTQMERIRLQEGCVKLMKELRLSKEHSAVSGPPFPPFLIPALAVLVFMGLIVISLLLAKKLGLRHPGAGVIGSVIHYPQDCGEMVPEVTGDGYRTL